MNRTVLSSIKAAALTAVAFIAFSQDGSAMPASPRPVMMRGADGVYRQVMLHGDEHYHAVTTPDGLTELRPDASGVYREFAPFEIHDFELSRKAAGKKVKVNISPSTSFPCFGEQRGVAILVNFPATDKHPEGRRFGGEDPRQLFDDLLNGDNYSTDGATGSVRQYFLDSSAGQMDLSFDVYGPVELSRDISFYCDKSSGEDLNAWNMVVEACQALDSQVDFSIYDRDRDGVIDNVYIFYAGPGAATGGDPNDCIWQHASDVESLSGKQFLFDGVRLNHYACSNEYRDVREEDGRIHRLTEGIGTVCHEFSHVLGLPDLYDVYGRGNNTPGVWSVMDTGCHLDNSRTPCLYSALDRMQLGWLEPEKIGDTPRTLSLPDISNNKAYLIPTDREEEFFLIENRQNLSWDKMLPGHGMILWRVNYKKDYWDNNQVNTGKSSSHAVVIPADGYSGPSTAEGDPFPGTSGVRDITDDGWPNMLSSQGTRTNAPISNITEAAGIISFDICRAITHLDRVEGLRVEDLTPHSFLAVWDPLPLSPGYLITVSDASGTPVGIYDNLNVADSPVRVSGLEPASTYTFTVCGVAGKIKGEPSLPFEVTTPQMSFAFSIPEVIEPGESDSESFMARWNPLDEAVDYALSVFTLEEDAPRIATIDFTGGIEALASGWDTNCVTTMSMSGYFGLSAPSLSMNADYARLSTPMLSRELTGLTFWYRERNASGKSRIEISVLNEGKWKVIETVELTEIKPEGSLYVVEPSNIPAGSMAAKIEYRRVEKGTLALDDVTVASRGDRLEMPLEGWTARRLGTADTEAKVTGLLPETDYYYAVCGINSEDIFSLPSVSMKATTGRVSGIKVNELERTFIISPDGTIQVADDMAFEVFDLTGRNVGKRLPSRGAYILKTNQKSIKILF